jgi:hypothetical protein
MARKKYLEGGSHINAWIAYFTTLKASQIKSANTRRLLEICALAQRQENQVWAVMQMELQRLGAEVATCATNCTPSSTSSLTKWRRLPSPHGFGRITAKRSSTPLENEETAIRWAARMIRECQRRGDELIPRAPLPLRRARLSGEGEAQNENSRSNLSFAKPLTVILFCFESSGWSILRRRTCKCLQRRTPCPWCRVQQGMESRMLEGEMPNRGLSRVREEERDPGRRAQ